MSNTVQKFNLRPESMRVIFYLQILFKVRRMKAIFLAGDAIFDSGFVEFLNLVSRKAAQEQVRSKMQENEGGDYDLKKRKGGFYVYEYLHENYGSQANFQSFKQYLKNNYTISTHFDGIDAIFGLPFAYFHSLLKKNETMDYPFSGFLMENMFSSEDLRFSQVLMNYYSNFIKNGLGRIFISIETFLNFFYEAISKRFARET